ncbi:MAG: copper resistance system multicopper oxidase [Gammaproteobacteria bacterium]|nr:MAG: copper resistance system multicopper oxidase [Gammaproteobacteria bacterium]
MSKIIIPGLEPASPSRRQFVKGLAAGGALMGLGFNAFAKSNGSTNQILSGPAVLSGTNFDLTYSYSKVNFTGKNRLATAINGSVPAPTLRWKEGDTVTLNVTNNMADDTSIHWHGIILPSAMDGVPNIADGFKGIKPGETFKYRFKVEQSGTYWYHSHSGFQEQTGAYGAIVIDPIKPTPYKFDRDYVVVISDWTDEEPTSVFHKLKKRGDYYNFRERTIGDAMGDLTKNGWSKFWAQRNMWNQMRMSDRDISDVTAYTYTYLTNGRAPADGWTGLFKKGEKVLLRFINAAAMTFFDVRIPGLKMTVVAADGQNIEPVTVDEFRIGVAETYDVVVEPSDDRAYSIFSQAIDRSGYSRGTLTPDPSMTIAVPKMDPAPILTHGDMGMNMANMDHGSMGHDMSGGGMAGMDHSKMKGMEHSKMNMPKIGSGKAGYGTSRKLTHVDSEYGPHIDMRAEDPQFRLDDPGIGLRNNGRRVLTYADIRSLYKTYDSREPTREIEYHLTGNMSRYMWSVNGIKLDDAEKLKFKFGERLRINLVNDTMMNHPIHLHGMWSDLETGDGRRIPRKHTVIAQPGAQISYLVTADAMGGWAYHCHLFYHMAAGMFRHVEVS